MSAVPTSSKSGGKNTVPTTSASSSATSEGRRIRQQQQHTEKHRVVLGSTLPTRGDAFIGPLTNGNDQKQLNGKRQLRAATHANVRTAARITVIAALGLAIVETLARTLGRTTAVTGTLLAPSALDPILNPAVDRSAALLALLLAPLFSVQAWSSIAPFASIALKLSPMPTIMKVRERGDTAGLPLLPYSAMATMTFVLVVYGILVRDPKIALTHGVGHVISLFYCAMFLRNCPEGTASRTNLPGTPAAHGRVGVTIASALLLAVAALGRRVGTSIAGMTSVVLSCVMYAGPLAALRDAVRTRSARNIPLPYALASSVNAIAWTVYGYFGRDDFMVWAPGFIGLLSSSAQIVLNVVYGDGGDEAEAGTRK